MKVAFAVEFGFAPRECGLDGFSAGFGLAAAIDLGSGAFRQSSRVRRHKSCAYLLDHTCPRLLGVKVANQHHRVDEFELLFVRQLFGSRVCDVQPAPAAAVVVHEVAFLVRSFTLLVERLVDNHVGVAPRQLGSPRVRFRRRQPVLESDLVEEGDIPPYFATCMYNTCT